jgi:hypothetical protein
MATDAAGRRAGGVRPWLLVVLAVLLAALVWKQMFSGETGRAPVTTATPRSGAKKVDQIDPAELDVKIEALKESPAAPADGDRNPFRFQPKPAPPSPPRPPVDAYRPPPQPSVPPAPVGPPPIGDLIKFIGIVDTGKGKIGAFSDCRYTFSGREGEIIEGRFRVVRIGVESVVLEYADGRGRTTLPLNGQACVGK